MSAVIGILPDNYVAAVDAIEALDAETRRVCRRRLPTDPAALAAELEYWNEILAWVEVARRQADHIQARAIRGCGALAKELYEVKS
jgi:hypothetical protein